MKWLSLIFSSSVTFIKGYWVFIRTVLYTSVVVAVFLGGVHYEHLKWEAYDSKVYQKNIKVLKQQVIDANKKNKETEDKLKREKESFASLIVQLGKSHETTKNPPCSATTDSMSVISAAIRATNTSRQ